MLVPPQPISLIRPPLGEWDESARNSTFNLAIMATPDTPIPGRMKLRTTAQARAGHASDDAIDATDAYFATMGELRRAVADRRYATAAELTLENMKQIPQWIAQQRTTRYRSVPPVIPAFEVGGTMMAIMEDESGLHEMMTLVEQVPELSDRKATIQRHLCDLRLFRQIKRVVSHKPGCMQSSMKSMTGVSDGRRLALLIQWLEKHGSIVRRRKGRSFQLYCRKAAPKPVSPRVSFSMSLRKGGRQQPHLLALVDAEHVSTRLSAKEWQAYRAREADYSRNRSDQLESYDGAFCLVDSPVGRSTGLSGSLSTSGQTPPFGVSTHAENESLWLMILQKPRDFPTCLGRRSVTIALESSEPRNLCWTMSTDYRRTPWETGS